MVASQGTVQPGSVGATPTRHKKNPFTAKLDSVSIGICNWKVYKRSHLHVNSFCVLTVYSHLRSIGLRRQCNVGWRPKTWFRYLHQCSTSYTIERLLAVCMWQCICMCVCVVCMCLPFQGVLRINQRNYEEAFLDDPVQHFMFLVSRLHSSTCTLWSDSLCEEWSLWRVLHYPLQGP